MSITRLSSALVALSALGAALVVTVVSRQQCQHAAQLVEHGEQTLAELDDAVQEIARLARAGRQTEQTRPGQPETDVIWMPRQAVHHHDN